MLTAREREQIGSFVEAMKLANKADDLLADARGLNSRAEVLEEIQKQLKGAGILKWYMKRLKETDNG